MKTEVRRHQPYYKSGDTNCGAKADRIEGYAVVVNILTFAGRPQETIILLEKGMQLNLYGPSYVIHLFAWGHA